MNNATNILEEHANDGHHRKAAIGDFGIELFRLLSRVGGGQHLEPEVTRIGCSARLLCLRRLAVGHVQENLTPTCLWHLGDCSQTVRDVCEFESCAWAQVSWEFSGDLGRDVTHGCKHCNSSVLNFGSTAALEVLDAAIR